MHFYVPPIARKDTWSYGPHYGWHLQFNQYAHLKSKTKDKHIKGEGLLLGLML